MTRALDYCWNNDVTTVICAGNNEGTSFYLDDKTPQNLGTASNGLITVGGVTSAGVLWPQTIPSRGFGGSISVYAQAQDVIVASISSNTATTSVDGTSVAAPAVVCHMNTRSRMVLIMSRPVLPHIFSVYLR